MSPLSRLAVLALALVPTLASAKAVQIFEHANYEGRSAAFGEGRFDIDDLGIGIDALSSALVPAGMTVILYEHANFQGRQLVLTADTAYVGDGLNDKASSMIVKRSPGAATIYEHAQYGGASKSFAPGRYDLNALGIGNDVLSSLKVGRGVRVVLYVHANFQGRSRVITQNTPWIGDEWNDLVSSMEVFGR